MGLLDSIGLILFVGVEQDTLMKERADAAAHQKENLPLAAFCIFSHLFLTTMGQHLITQLCV